MTLPTVRFAESLTPSQRILVGDREVTIYTTEDAAALRALASVATLEPDRDTDCNPWMLAAFCAVNLLTVAASVAGVL